MATQGSVTLWIHGLRTGEKDAASRIWERFFNRMKRLAKIRTSPAVTQGAYDEEDVALSAFANFYRAMRDGNYPELTDRTELWRILATFTYRKARERALSAQALKRGGESRAKNKATQLAGFDEFEAQTPPPDLIAMVNEQCAYLFGLLKDPELENVCAWKLEGYTNEEIAELLGYTRRTVQRMLALIRRIWTSTME